MTQPPPPLHSVTEDGGYWHFAVNGRASVVSIRKPEKDTLRGYRRGAGELTISPPKNGISTVYFGYWALAAVAIKKHSISRKSAKTNGWILVVKALDPKTKAWREARIAFQSRHSKPSLHRWVTLINNRFKRTMGKPQPVIR